MMEEDTHLTIEGKPYLLRDKVSKSVINTNESERQAYLIRKNAIMLKQNRIDMMEKRIANLEAQIKILMDALNK